MKVRNSKTKYLLQWAAILAGVTVVSVAACSVVLGVFNLVF